ncbi:hypothetical protein BC332_20199 [Capsicum chinense]|nr:hypothetical protein BC332_20199 [Capsicum chinense]
MLPTEFYPNPGSNPRPLIKGGAAPSTAPCKPRLLRIARIIKVATLLTEFYPNPGSNPRPLIKGRAAPSIAPCKPRLLRIARIIKVAALPTEFSQYPRSNLLIKDGATSSIAPCILRATSRRFFGAVGVSLRTISTMEKDKEITGSQKQLEGALKAAFPDVPDGCYLQ